MGTEGHVNAPPPIMTLTKISNSSCRRLFHAISAPASSTYPNLTFPQQRAVGVGQSHTKPEFKIQLLWFGQHLFEGFFSVTKKVIVMSKR